MNNNEEALKLVQKCLDDWPYAATRVCSIMTRLEKVKDLLKAQEPVKPVFDAGDGKTIGQFLCGKCHVKIGLGHPHFCWYCGQAVKWDG